MRSQVLARLVHSANPNNKPKKSNPATVATASAGRMRRARCVGGLAFSSPGAGPAPLVPSGEGWEARARESRMLAAFRALACRLGLWPTHWSLGFLFCDLA